MKRVKSEYYNRVMQLGLHKSKMTIIKNVLIRDTFCYCVFGVDKYGNRIMILHNKWCDGYKWYDDIEYEQKFRSKDEGNEMYKLIKSEKHISKNGTIWYNLNDVLGWYENWKA